MHLKSGQGQKQRRGDHGGASSQGGYLVGGRGLPHGGGAGLQKSGKLGDTSAFVYVQLIQFCGIWYLVDRITSEGKRDASVTGRVTVTD